MAHPFDENVRWGEDLHWAVRNSQLGYTSGCTSLSCVYHHHYYSKSERKAIRKLTENLCKELFDWPIDNKDKIAAYLRTFISAESHLHAILNVVNKIIISPMKKVHLFIINLFNLKRNVH
jgi:hypothetical protein